MKHHFYKYHGAGNDFLLIDDRKEAFLPDPVIIARMCIRSLGIGADGLILIRSAEGYDFRMHYYNSDGQESTMCGNGGRCVIALADFLSLSKGKVSFLAHDGSHLGWITAGNDPEYTVRLQMKDAGPIKESHGGHFIDTGSPHLVLNDPDVQNLEIISAARPLRFHPDFLPGGTNVNFMTANGPGIFVRSYERGVEDETLSCGTGVTASALVYAWQKRMNQGRIPVKTRGGQLEVHFKRDNTMFADIWLEGPAVKVFEGDYIV